MGKRAGLPGTETAPGLAGHPGALNDPKLCEFKQVIARSTTNCLRHRTLTYLSHEAIKPTVAIIGATTDSTAAEVI